MLGKFSKLAVTNTLEGEDLKRHRCIPVHLPERTKGIASLMLPLLLCLNSAYLPSLSRRSEHPVERSLFQSNHTSISGHRRKPSENVFHSIPASPDEECLYVWEER